MERQKLTKMIDRSERMYLEIEREREVGAKRGRETGERPVREGGERET